MPHPQGHPAHFPAGFFFLSQYMLRITAVTTTIKTNPVRIVPMLFDKKAPIYSSYKHYFRPTAGRNSIYKNPAVIRNAITVPNPK